MTRVLSAIGLAVVLCGCGASDEKLGAPAEYRIPGCEQYDASACDVLAADCQQRLLDIAACLRGEPSAAPPPISVMTEADYADYLRGLFAAQKPDPSTQAFETAFSLFGLVAPGGLNDEMLIATEVAAVDGVYRDDMKDIVLIDHGKPANAQISSDVLVHECIHALQDRDVDLLQYAHAHGDSFDSFLAADALTEGEARFHETRYRAAMVGLDPRHVDWKRTFENGVELTEAWLLAQTSLLTSARLGFPYAWGARSVSFDWSSTGLAGVLARFAAPPATTHELMASSETNVADDFTPSAPELPAAPEGLKLEGTETLGSLGTFLLLGPHTSVERARALAIEWRGDRFGVYASASDAASAVSAIAVWYADFSTPDVAAEVAGGLAGSGRVVRTSDSRVFVAAAAAPAVDFNWALPEN